MRRRLFVCSSGIALVMGCSSTARPPAPAPAVTEAGPALAPSGALRVAFLAGPIYATRDPASGLLRGVAVDLGQALAQRLGVPLEALPQPHVPAVLAGVAGGQFDVVMMGVNAERAAVVDFAAPYMAVEQGVLARPGLPLRRVDDIDRPGLRVGVLEKAGPDTLLSRQLAQATLVRSPSLDHLFARLAGGHVDLAAATKSRLLEEMQKLPGSAVLDGNLLTEPIAMGLPKGRPAAAGHFLAAFTEEVKARGLVAQAIHRNGLRGVSVASLAAGEPAPLR